MKDERLIEAVISEYPRAAVNPAERVLLDYAVKLTREPWSVTPEDIMKLRGAGWSDAAILDLNLVVSYYNFVNRVADGLGVELEPRWSKQALQEHS